MEKQENIGARKNGTIGTEEKEEAKLTELESPPLCLDDSEDDREKTSTTRFVAKRCPRKKKKIESSGSDDDGDDNSNFIGKSEAAKDAGDAWVENNLSSSEESENGRSPVSASRTARGKAVELKKKKRARIEDDSSDERDSFFARSTSPKKRKDTVSGDDSSSSDDDGPATKRSRIGRRGPKPIMSDDKLQKETIDAGKAEQERRKRLEAKQKEFNGIIMADDEDLATALKSTQSSQRLKSVVLDPDRGGDPPCPVAVHQSLVKFLKPHQANGVQFLYDSAIESLDRLDEEGGGGILAHCMGLGKTLQVIAFLHTTMMHPKIGQKIKRVLVVVPKNVVLNWFNEFEKWLDNDEVDRDLNTIDVVHIDSLKTYSSRHAALQNWYTCKTPTVMIIGYDMFRILTRNDDEDCRGKKNASQKKKTKQNKKLQKLQPDFRKFLQNPGPDLIICDEAHKIKNDGSALTMTMAKIKTKRRLCLTGTPLQNNLSEYYCMVNFVKPGLLGTKAEFANRFANVINRGRVKDAVPQAVCEMRRRCHVLHETLKKVVDRKDYSVLKDAIPPKQEYVLNVRLTPRQIELYKAFLERVDDDGVGLSKRLLPDYHILSRIWTHPYQLIAHEIAADRKRALQQEKEDDDDFVDSGDETPSAEETDEELVALESDDCDDESTVAASSEGNAGVLNGEVKSRKSRRLAGENAEAMDIAPETPPEYEGWFSKTNLVSDSDENDFSLSNKLILLIEILKKCEEIGDKVLVFSQSIESLCLIKRMLLYMDVSGKWFADGHEAVKAVDEVWGWKEGYDYMVIDGQVQSHKRHEAQKKFNDPANLRARLMLISTRAGSLGTNMVAANRVIIFDACWNPSHDTQSLFRVYRFGQSKPVYIYRFIAQGTMEERIYKRQVTKESTSMRVVDEAQIQRHFAGHDLEELYKFDPDVLENDESDRPCMAPPKQDRLLGEVILSHKNCIVSYIQHDSLFENVDAEKLSEAECKEAWDEFEREKNMMASSNRMFNYEQQYTAEQRMMMISRQEQSQKNALAQLNSDPIYVSSFQIRGMDTDTAMKVTYLKRSLDALLPAIPFSMRGGINEFSTYFIAMIREGVNTASSPIWLLNKAVNVFRTVVAMTRSVPACIPILRHLYNSTSQFFDPEQPPP